MLKFIAALSLILLPVSASAQTVPDFPMAFWGAVTLNGSPAPVGTVVNAYYGSTLAGTATVQEAGVYGYTESTKQKLIVGSGSSTITFKVQSSGFNGGTETTGDTTQTHPGFTAGETIQKDLAFTYTPPAPPPATGGGGSPAPSGGGGGGGGGISYNYSVKINNDVATTTSQNVTLTINPASSANQMQVSNTPDFTGLMWLPFSSSYPWTLSSSAGLKTVYVRYGSASTTVANAQDSILFSENNTTTSVQLTQTTQTQSGQVLGVSTFKFNKNLSKGMTDGDVLELQKRLIAEGLLKIDAPTTYFGAMTFAAVKSYQAKNGLEQVGNVGPKTRAVLNAGAGTTGTPDTGKQLLIDLLLKQVQALLAQIAAIKAGQATSTAQ